MKWKKALNSLMQWNKPLPKNAGHYQPGRWPCSVSQRWLSWVELDGSPSPNRERHLRLQRFHQLKLPSFPSLRLSVFRDDFDNTLAEGWNILREVSTHWSLTDKPGSWRVTLIPGTFDGFIPELPTNVLLREAPKGDFEIATLVHFTPTSNYQFAGLFVYQDDQNVVQLGRSYCDRPDACVGNGIYFDSIGNVIDSIATVTTNPSLAYLRLRREGTTYTGYYSEDGESWTTIGQHISNINPVQVGLMAGQALEVETTADFEYFTMEELPSISSVLSEWRTLSSIFRMRISSVSRKAAVLPSQIQIPILLRDLMKSLKVISS
jgi:regulation of enolase protein 1 (concanavalin A-like superfamily)